MYLAPDLCIGYQYLSLGCIQISLLVVSHTMHSSFKDDSTLLGHTSFLQLSCFCIPLQFKSNLTTSDIAHTILTITLHQINLPISILKSFSQLRSSHYEAIISKAYIKSFGRLRHVFHNLYTIHYCGDHTWCIMSRKGTETGCQNLFLVIIHLTINPAL